MKVVALERERVKKLSDFPEATRFLFKGTLSYARELLRWKTMKGDDDVREALTKVVDILSQIPEGEWTQDVIAAKVKGIAQGDNGGYFWPMRVALSGREKSPGPQEIAEVLGKTKTLQRIEDAKNLLG
jgi:glutamyl/glutaminyl-tRNA synthetase